MTIRIPSRDSHRKKSSPLVEVTSGELRIGKELNRYQEFLKTWYFTCYTMGTLIFATLYLVTFEIMRAYWEQYWQHDPYEDIHISFEDSLSWNDRDHPPEERERPDDEPVPNEVPSDVNVNIEDLSIDFSARDDSCGEWEDMFYPAATDLPSMPSETPLGAQYRQGPQRR